MAWSDFFNNMREALQKAEQEQKTPAQSGANTSLNDILRPNIQRPEITYGAHSAERNAPRKKSYQQVWGFDQDKANYGNERNGDSLTWRDLSVHNNDTDEDLSISVGYDSDGRISGVRKNENGNIRGYYGQDLVGDFFKNNFDRDATDYTVFDADTEGDSRKWVLFDSKHDGPFIPSYALSSERRSQPIPRLVERPDKPIKLDEELIDEMRREYWTEYNLMRLFPDINKYNAAMNGAMYADGYYSGSDQRA